MTRSFHPIKWVLSRDRTPLNNLALVLMPTGVAAAIAIWAAHLATPSFPLWLAYLGAAMTVAGVILFCVTIGPAPPPPPKTAAPTTVEAKAGSAMGPSLDKQIEDAHDDDVTLDQLFSGTKPVKATPPGAPDSREATDAGS